MGEKKLAVRYISFSNVHGFTAAESPSKAAFSALGNGMHHVKDILLVLLYKSRSFFSQGFGGFGLLIFAESVFQSDIFTATIVIGPAAAL